MLDRPSIQADQITNRPGAYLLVIDLSVPCAVTLSRRPAMTLPPGRYGYCGSAYGTGGLRARVARHLRQEKACHWHIDQLTCAGSVVEFRLIPGGCECDILEQLTRQAGVGIPIPGFGSSDCVNCPAHLVSLPVHISLPGHGQPVSPIPGP
ncbi:MAG: GIY-YIG nuclease family protein [Alphaproteobacteria bacterium]